MGTVGTQSGVLGDVYHSAVKSLEAWVAKINAEGGINCHKVKHLVGDDGADPARHQALVRRFVEEEKVIAFVLNNAPVTGAASEEYLKQKQVPVIGQEGGQFFFYDSPVHFPVAASGEMLQRLTVAAGARIAVPLGKTKAALVTCQEVEYCNRADTVYPDQAKKSGLSVVYTVKATLTQPDYTAQCLGARNAGADVMMAVFDGNGLTRLTASCAKIGYHPILVIVSNTSTSDHLKDPNMEGTVVSSPKRPWFLADHKGVAEFQAAVKQYAPGLPIEASGIDGWEPGKAFEHIARRIAPNEVPTSKAILDSANSLNGDDIDGLVFPLTFHAGQPHKQVACGWAVVTGKGKFTTDGQMFCVPGYEL
ncbi:MAG TPA: ABC transporter substrate-binding protein [Acidimicrobiia bacterium]|nr:ABC transporter substrate-binding protein [Acidimicrobiia bacterium]